MEIHPIITRFQLFLLGPTIDQIPHLYRCENNSALGRYLEAQNISSSLAGKASATARRAILILEFRGRNPSLLL